MKYFQIWKSPEDILWKCEQLAAREQLEQRATGTDGPDDVDGYEEFNADGGCIEHMDTEGEFGDESEDGESETLRPVSFLLLHMLLLGFLYRFWKRNLILPMSFVLLGTEYQLSIPDCTRLFVLLLAVGMGISYLLDICKKETTWENALMNGLQAAGLFLMIQVGMLHLWGWVSLVIVLSVLAVEDLIRFGRFFCGLRGLWAVLGKERVQFLSALLVRWIRISLSVLAAVCLLLEPLGIIDRDFLTFGHYERSAMPEESFTPRTEETLKEGWASAELSEKENVLQELAAAESAFLGLDEIPIVKAIKIEQNHIYGEEILRRGYYVASDHEIYIDLEQIMTETAEESVRILLHEMMHAWQHQYVWEDALPEKAQMGWLDRKRDIYQRELWEEECDDYRDYYMQLSEIEAREYSTYRFELYREQLGLDEVEFWELLH